MARDYGQLITSQHRTAPRFMATVAATTDPFAGVADLGNSMTTLFDVDTAKGVQLDQIGLWVGASRTVTVEVGSYFSFDVVNQGFDQGIWYNLGDDLTYLSNLDDEHYRFLIRAKIACNKWDGSYPGAYKILYDLLSPQGAQITIQEGPMSVVVSVSGTLTILTQALLVDGYVKIKPATVSIFYDFRNLQTVAASVLSGPS